MKNNSKKLDYKRQKIHASKINEYRVIPEYTIIKINII